LGFGERFARVCGGHRSLAAGSRDAESDGECAPAAGSGTDERHRARAYQRAGSAAKLDPAALPISCWLSGALLAGL
jgi:hypothetical protein